MQRRRDRRADDAGRRDLQRRAEPREHRRRLPALRRAVRVVRPRATPPSLESVLAESAGAAKRMVVTDAVFSMDGTVAPLPSSSTRRDRHDAFVMLDEAHATGVLGAAARARSSTSAWPAASPVVMGTLGKALGSVGGFIAGSRDLIDIARRSARSFLFTTSLPPATGRAALESLRILRAEPERVGGCGRTRALLHAGFAELGLRGRARGGADHPGVPATTTGRRRPLAEALRAAESSCSRWARRTCRRAPRGCA